MVYYVYFVGELDNVQLVLEFLFGYWLCFSGVMDCLLINQLLLNCWFELWLLVLCVRVQCEGFEIEGLCGLCIDLIGYQLYIVDQVVWCYVFRVLLVDEVGLGKIIEVGLIFY